MKRLSVFMIFILILSLVSCGGSSWKGFYEEDLSKFLDLGEYKGLSYEAFSPSVFEDEVDLTVSSMLEAIAELKENEDGASSEASAVRFDGYCFVFGTVLSAILSRNIIAKDPFAEDKLDEQ